MPCLVVLALALVLVTALVVRAQVSQRRNPGHWAGVRAGRMPGLASASTAPPPRSASAGRVVAPSGTPPTLGPAPSFGEVLGAGSPSLSSTRDLPDLSSDPESPWSL